MKHPRLVAVAVARTDDQEDFARMYDMGFNCAAYDYVMVGLVAALRCFEAPHFAVTNALSLLRPD